MKDWRRFVRPEYTTDAEALRTLCRGLVREGYDREEVGSGTGYYYLLENGRGSFPVYCLENTLRLVSVSHLHSYTRLSREDLRVVCEWYASARVGDGYKIRRVQEGDTLYPQSAAREISPVQSALLPILLGKDPGGGTIRGSTPEWLKRLSEPALRAMLSEASLSAIRVSFMRGLDCGVAICRLQYDRGGTVMCAPATSDQADEMPKLLCQAELNRRMEAVTYELQRRGL